MKLENIEIHFFPKFRKNEKRAILFNAVREILFPRFSLLCLNLLKDFCTLRSKNIVEKSSILKMLRKFILRNNNAENLLIKEEKND